jgi:carbamoyl-phosphate synthase large subunit
MTMIRDCSLTGMIHEDNTLHPKFEMENINWVETVSTTKIYQIVVPDSFRHVLVIDCGVKTSILRSLLHLGTNLHIVPYDFDFQNEYEAKYHYLIQGIVISNGPGDPLRLMDSLVPQLKWLMNNYPDLPILGICLGHQLLALASGAKTYKMKFGNRGLNQSVKDLRNAKCYVTSQNHGYAVQEDSLPLCWKPLFVNLNDGSNEGIIHINNPWIGIQFHPEAHPGPLDTLFLFEEFLHPKNQMKLCPFTKHVKPLKKVLLLGSGPLTICQNAEFDYTGSQAIKALEAENIQVILMNPNIATVQETNKTYYYPITKEFVTKVIELERPDGILLQFGGQTALNCGISIRDILETYNVKVLGTSIDTIIITEDRGIFASKMQSINEKTIASQAVTNVQDAILAANTLGYPVLVRSAFTLGGMGSGFASDDKALQFIVDQALCHSLQVIIDKSLYGFKEIEYEMVRDCQGNCIAVCNMENIDPVGIHTGDSMVVAPAQTVTNEEYFNMRETAIKVVQFLQIVGECNIQFALNPITSEYFIIEVNARLSRSSSLASKATGYPLAFIAAKLAIGKLLFDIPNPMTLTTCAFFEPALDYIVVKLPHWDFDKFCGVSRELGPSMKSIAEVMSIDCTFEAAFMKAIRMNGIDFFKIATWDQVNTDKRINALFTAIRLKKPIQEIHEETKISYWFLEKLFKIIECESEIKRFGFITRNFLLHCKKMGFSDDQISFLRDHHESICDFRFRYHIEPGYNPIDTSAGEFVAISNYRYLSYHTSFGDWKNDDSKKHILVLGCGCYRIGLSCEYDYSTVHTLRSLRKLNQSCIMINNNPDTVSTDFNECDILYFEELSPETIAFIYFKQQVQGVIVSVAGQTPNNLAQDLVNHNLTILGTSAKSIQEAENRFLFSNLMDKHHISQPLWHVAHSKTDVFSFASKVEYPVLVRPSYVLSGSSMNIAYNEEQLETCLNLAVSINEKHPVVISKFIENAKEIEYDGVANNGNIINFAISEHVENAGTHSGDATLMIPAQKIYNVTWKEIRKISAQIAKILNITGCFNVQYLCKKNHVMVIECNLRASRSMPFVSKALHVNFIELSTRCILKFHVEPVKISCFEMDYVCVKSPMFSYNRLANVDPISNVEMKSVGETACFSQNVNEAFLLSLMSSGFKLPRNNILITIGPQKYKQDFLESLIDLAKLGFHLFGTVGTRSFYGNYGIQMDLVSKDYENSNQSAVSLIVNQKCDMVINIPNLNQLKDVTDGFKIRRAAIDHNISLISNIQQAIMIVEACKEHQIGSYSEYNFQVQHALSF